VSVSVTHYRERKRFFNVTQQLEILWTPWQDGDHPKFSRPENGQRGIYEQDCIETSTILLMEIADLSTLIPPGKLLAWFSSGLVRLANRLTVKESIYSQACFEQSFLSIRGQVYIAVTVVVTVTVN
jgi:hypothetical protein